MSKFSHRTGKHANIDQQTRPHCRPATQTSLIQTKQSNLASSAFGMRYAHLSLTHAHAVSSLTCFRSDSVLAVAFSHCLTVLLQIHCFFPACTTKQITASPFEGPGLGAAYATSIQISTIHLTSARRALHCLVPCRSSVHSSSDRFGSEFYETLQPGPQLKAPNLTCKFTTNM